MNGPKRWRDDPGVLEELGVDLEAERASLTSHDLDAVQGAIEAKVAAGISTSIAPYVIGTLMIAGVGAALWWSSAEQPRPELTAPPSVAKVDMHQVRIVPKAPPKAEAKPAAKMVTKTNIQRAESKIEPAPKAEAHSDLAAQLDLYERGQQSLAGKDPSAAVTAFESYLSRYPSGRLEIEARLGLLHAHFAAESYPKAAAVAEALLESPLAMHRRMEILRVLAESRALQGECAGATAAFDAANVAQEIKVRALARCKSIAKDAATN